MIPNRDRLQAEMIGVETSNAIDQWLDDSLHIASGLNELSMELATSGQAYRADVVARASDAIIDAVAQYRDVRILAKEVMSR